jgi:hypothetical protein
MSLPRRKIISETAADSILPSYYHKVLTNQENAFLSAASAEAPKAAVRS